jgi:quinol monooxygenase YgiN
MSSAPPGRPPARRHRRNLAIIVAGYLQVAPEHRAAYLSGCRKLIELARTAPGCRGFALSPDPIEPGRINIFERWDSVEDLETFRGADPGGPDAEAIIDTYVEQYEIRTGVLL